VKIGEKRSYKSYTKEFNEEAVNLVTEQGCYSVSEEAKPLGIKLIYCISGNNRLKINSKGSH